MSRTETSFGSRTCQSALAPGSDSSGAAAPRLRVKRPRGHLLQAAMIVVITAVSPCIPVAQGQDSSASARIARAQEYLDAGNPELALGLVKPLIQKRDASLAEALLIRSTAQLMLGELEAGKKNLDQALSVDPALRQGWINRAALELSEQRYEAAYKAFIRAKELSPEALDNHLNLGAVELLMGQLEAAQTSFERYLQASSGSAEALYLVATNYASNGYVALATATLKKAVIQDERIRLRVRTDANFSGLSSDPSFQQVLLVDPYRPPQGSWVQQRRYQNRYQAGEATFISAMLDVLQFHGIAFDANVEVTPNWALIWGPVRIKLSNTQSEGTVTLSAVAGTLSPSQWQELKQKIFSGFAKRVNGLPLIPGVD